MSIEDLALLDCLRQAGEGLVIQHGQEALIDRLVESALVEHTDDRVFLTVAGIELCKSLQHRQAAHVEAARLKGEL